MAAKKKKRVTRLPTYKDYAHVRAGLNYARAIVAKKIPAGKFTRLACERQINDLRRSISDPDYPFVFDPKAAERPCKFVELLPHVKGKWARRKELIVLGPWQQFLITVLFGWIRKSDGTRRFREAYICVPRKNAKSTTVAGIGLYLFVADRESGSEVYSGASTEKQAFEVFGPARKMTLKTPDLIEAFDIDVRVKNMNVPDDGSKFEVVIGQPGDGASPHAALIDEYHEHRTPEMFDTMLTGQGAREQPLIIVITTAGNDIFGPCYEKQQEIENILSGSYEDDEKFGLIYHVDPEDDWTTEHALTKANPNIDVSVSKDFLLSRQREAVAQANQQNRFKTKHLNVWVSAKEAYFNQEKFIRLGELDFADKYNLLEMPAIAGLDLASKRDFTAFVRIHYQDIKGKTHYYLAPTFYLPEERVFEDTTGRFQGWAERGYIQVTDGNETDYTRITENIRADFRAYQIAETAFDPWNASHLAQRLSDEGGEMVEIRQSPLNMGQPMDEFNSAIESGRVHHDGNPVMAWMIGNVINARPAAKMPYPGKERAENKIDGPVAVMIGLRRIIDGIETVSSAYESRGVVVV